MEILYMNGYRGFREQTLRFNWVNYFVWENSTWKTSALKAISFLVSSDFWFQFKIWDALGFSSYSSVGDEKYFELGFINSDKESWRQFILVQIGNDNWEFALRKVFTLTQEWGFGIDYRKEKGSIFRIPQKRYIKELNSEKPEDLFKKIPSEKFYWKKIGTYERIPPFVALSIASREYTWKTLSFIDGCWSFAPIRATPKDIYFWRTGGFTPEWAHIPYLFKTLSTKKKEEIKLMNQFWENSGLFEEIKINPLMKNEFKSSPFRVEIRIKGKFYNIADVGYWVSQILPLIVEPLLNPNNLLTIQQPEVHLHPRAQAEYGSYLFKILERNPNKQFFIETHSDFIIDRFKFEAAKTVEKLTRGGKVHFFSKKEDTNSIESFPLNWSGNAETLPAAYREFFLQESINLLWI